VPTVNAITNNTMYHIVQPFYGSIVQFAFSAYGLQHRCGGSVVVFGG
jgi:hypothetical protein